VQVVPSDTFIYRNSSVQLLAGASGGRLTAFNWQPTQYLSCTQCLDPVARVPYSVRYVFTGTNQHNCTASDTVQINMYTDGPVNIPNAFTPNGDGKNDVFYILGSRDVERLKDFSIYDRLGQRVFQARDVPPNDPVYGWKGDVRGVVSGTNTFAYVVVVRFRDGREQMFKGTVTVIR
jgi:gliding motility-associated-like protein